MGVATLHRLLHDSARAWPDRDAVVDEAGTIRYADLAMVAGRLRDRLQAMDVRPGDRVGIWLRKSIDGVAAIFAILDCGAAYVPVDPDAPAARNAYIFGHCGVNVVITESRFEAGLRAEFAALSTRDVPGTAGMRSPRLLVLSSSGGGVALRARLDELEAQSPCPRGSTIDPGPGALAYILYTSGSTGKPKGVMLTHENAISFIDWCSDTFAPSEHDRFSSHAPFHFDLSILDLYVPLRHGATLVLVGEKTGKDPARVAELIARERLTVWYSAPSILGLLPGTGCLGRLDYSALRLVLFAGEVFPVKHLRTLVSHLPGPRYFNLYGPTETNVCTFYEVPRTIPGERTAPYPIGRRCDHVLTRVVGDHGEDVPGGQEGELVVAGAPVMQGYWDREEETARAFMTDGSGRWYRTGDIVVVDGDGNYEFRGRRDRMVKRRGYRVELGEIEATLHYHPSVEEAAVVAGVDGEGAVLIRAFLHSREGTPLSLIELKRFCADHLPLYMVPDRFSFLESLPRTSTDKVDYQRLKAME